MRNPDLRIACRSGCWFIIERQHDLSGTDYTAKLQLTMDQAMAFAGPGGLPLLFSVDPKAERHPGTEAVQLIAERDLVAMTQTWSLVAGEVRMAVPRELVGALSSVMGVELSQEDRDFMQLQYLRECEKMLTEQQAKLKSSIATNGEAQNEVLSRLYAATEADFQATLNPSP